MLLLILVGLSLAFGLAAAYFAIGQLTVVVARGAYRRLQRKSAETPNPAVPPRT